MPLGKIWRTTDFVLKLIMAVVMFAMMTVTTCDVAGRYLFNAPIPGGFEIVQYLMALVVFAALPLTTASNSHLSVSLVENRLSGTGLRLHRFYTLGFSAIGLLVIAFRIAAQGNLLAESKQVSGYLSLPLAPIAWTMTFFAMMAVVIVLIMLVRAIMGLDPQITTTEAAIGAD
ncbi:MAG: TRAP transporter small permease [Beijerinckiaceae bacterium]|nr:TRAP transporter small permease [Beijerinckiaceae bacterium]